ncbi:MAG: glycosyl hydrolase family 28-related protein [Verrucomicrobiales bacterium]|nr:glycosyl hydrolase family 28-related protein [Verrucomicrobiales bacterium]
MEADFDLNNHNILNASNVYTNSLYLGGSLVFPSDFVYAATEDVINVKDFNVAGDLSVDDSPAFRAAFDAWHSVYNGKGVVVVPAGKYLMNGQAFSDAMIDYMAAGVSSGSYLTIVMQPGCEFYPAYTPRGLRTAGLWKDKVFEIPLFEFGFPNKSCAVNILGQGLIEGNRDVTTDPIGVLMVNQNQGTIDGIHCRALANRALEIQSINNTRSYNVRISGCGYQPSNKTSSGFLPSGVTFAVASGAVRLTASIAGIFEASDVGKWFGIYQSGKPTFFSKIATYVDSQTVDLTDNASATYTAANGSFSIVTGSMTAGDKTLTLDADCVPANYAGAIMHVYGAGYEDTSGSGGFNQTEPRLLSSRVTARTSGTEVELSHGARVSVSNVPVIFAPGVHIGYIDETEKYAGHNNDFQIFGMRVENAGNNKATVPLVLQKALRTEFFGSKFHVSPPHDDNFAAGAFAVVSDNSKSTIFSGCMFTWGGFDPDYGQVALLGDRLGASFTDCSWGLSIEQNRFWLFSADVVDVDDSYVSVSAGFNNIPNWSTTADRGYLKLLGNATLAKTWKQNGGIYERANGKVHWYLPTDDVYNSDGTTLVYDETRFAQTGTFTPTVEIGGSDITAGGGTLATAEGRYVRQQSLVWVWIHIALSAKGTNTGALDVMVPSTISTKQPSPIGPVYYDNFTGVSQGVDARVAGNNEIRLTQPGGGGVGTVNIDDSDLTDTSEFWIAGWYETDAP